MPMRYYDLPRKYRSCLNCIHFDQPLTRICGLWIGGCREKLVVKAHYTEEQLKKTYCGQWFLRSLDENDY